MSHSHLPARHLLRQIESDRSKRKRRDTRPEWLMTFIEQVAELFEPLADVGRVGFDCRLDEQGWSATLYLGAVELVGGKADGQTQRAGFRFDLGSLLERWGRVDDLAWTVLDHRPEESLETGPHSFLSIDGLIGEQRLRLEVHCAAPAPVGPGLRRLADGRYEPI